MNNQEKGYFEKLIETRQQFYNQIQEAEKKGTVEGYWNSVVDKYSDQAHFIYEILQNADDAEAQNAHFELFDDRLVFRHDGKRRFSVSDPDTYKQDRENKKVGDINGITSIGGSGKFLDDAKIGKFGLGFKAVFQYTLTPSIYDSNASFRIHNYIVPEIINDDYPGRKDNETIFVFPFDKPDISPEDAVEDIKEKLSKLIFPNLFLKNLEKITYDCFGEKGIFKKKVEIEKSFDDISAQFIKITKGKKSDVDMMWLFSRTDDANHKFSVGFFIDDEGHVSLPNQQYTAFCFFPTLVTTNLNFVIHAPFLLTDNREGIMAGNAHNKNMIQSLAELASDALECLCQMSTGVKKRLITDDIIDILPFQDNLFSPEYDKSKVSFMPFYNEIKRKMQSAEVLPTRKGYTSRTKAYWAETEDIPKLISDEQLTALVGSEAHFVFVSKGRNNTQHNAVFGKGRYIDSVVYSPFSEDALYRRIDVEFIQSQKTTWLIKLYRYILEGRNRATRVSKVKALPIFLDEEGNAVAAYDKNDHEILFLPDEEATGYTTINGSLFKNEHVKKLLNELDIKKPEQADRIFNKIIPQYVDGVKEYGSLKSDFRLFLKYYIECEGTDKEEDLIESIKGLYCIECKRASDDSKFVGKANDLYIPSDDLKEYFKGFDDVYFVDLDEYEGYISKKDWKYLEDFLVKLGVSKRVRRVKNVYGQDDEQFVYQRFGSVWPSYTISKKRLRKWTDYRLKGAYAVVDRIIEEKSKQLSIILWNQLLALFCNIKASWNKPVLGGVHEYPNYGNNYKLFEGFDAKKLKNNAWLLNSKGEFVCPKGLILQDISPLYNITANGIDELIEFLDMYAVNPEYENLSDDQVEKLQFIDMLKKFGLPSDITDDEARFMISALYKQRHSSDDSVTNENDGEDSSVAGSRVAREIEKRVAENKSKENEKKPKQTAAKEEEDSDELTRAGVNYADKIEKTKQKFEEEIRRIEELEDAQNRAHEAGKYSFGWFSALLELEAAANGEDNMSSREVSITFGKIERDLESTRTLLLKRPNKHIPQVLEELVDIPLVLNMPDKQPIKLVIEGSTIQSYTLKVRLKNEERLDEIDFSEVIDARIDAQNPSFLLRELQKQFAKFEYDDDYDMQNNLCDNIKFIFGPPGTGKTTHLARNVIMPLVAEEKGQKIIVLAPTNKAADVIVERIMSSMGNDHSYEKWLIRYGVTSNEKIEKSKVFHGKEIDIADYENFVLVTTIARFPYDYLIGKDKKRHYLYGTNWDYVIVDEASMIPLVQIVYPLYLKTPKQFIIAGDPFQIEPTFSVDEWKDENIYSMVNLDSFTDPQTVPYQYDVELLTTQYRSIPSVGTIFSELTYGGLLDHNRSEDSRRPLNIEKYLDYNSLNIIKFPVSKYESIYKAKKLKRSNYHAYSALFTYEFACYLARCLDKENPGEVFKIGIIAPYTAQAGLIDKLVTAADLPKNIKISSGTIHGFQGDECDIILAVFNPPPYISNSDKIFLNRKNIVNVAISRAKDYLFVIMPDDETDGVNELKLIKRVEGLIKEGSDYVETKSKWIENRIFNDPDYLEDHSFATGHQLVNVYGIPEQKYEIRSEENAIDVQVHDVKEEVKW